MRARRLARLPTGGNPPCFGRRRRGALAPRPVRTQAEARDEPARSAGSDGPVRPLSLPVSIDFIDCLPPRSRSDCLPPETLRLLASATHRPTTSAEVVRHSPSSEELVAGDALASSSRRGRDLHVHPPFGGPACRRMRPDDFYLVQPCDGLRRGARGLLAKRAFQDPASLPTRRLPSGSTALSAVGSSLLRAASPAAPCVFTLGSEARRARSSYRASDATRAALRAPNPKAWAPRNGRSLVPRLGALE